MEPKVKYFHSLDALRFCSCMFVFLQHLPAKELFPKFDVFEKAGVYGVLFFFTLSGFLITYIALTTKKESGNFSLRNFYLKRIFRIWPLFYFVVVFGFISDYVLRQFGLTDLHSGYFPNWIVTSLFMENYMTMYLSDFPSITPFPVFWSLCVEEHFYLIFGFLLWRFQAKSILKFIFIGVLIGLITRYIYNLQGIWFLDFFSNLDTFMFGALLAYLLIFKKSIIEAFNHKLSNTTKAVLFAFVLMHIYILNKSDYDYQYLFEIFMIAILFTAILLLFISTPESSKSKLFISRKNILSKLSKYTYSLYLTHFFSINLYLKIFKHLDLNWPEEITFLAFLALSLGTSILVSYVLYQLIEKPFLKLKNKILISPTPQSQY